MNQPIVPTAPAGAQPLQPVGVAPSRFHHHDIASAVRDHILVRIASQAVAAWEAHRTPGAHSPTAKVTSEAHAVIAALIDALLGGEVADNAEAIATHLIEADQKPDADMAAKLINDYVADADADRPPLPVARVEDDAVICAHCGARDSIFQDARTVAHNRVFAVGGGQWYLDYDEDFGDRLQPDEAFVCDQCQGLVALPSDPEGGVEWIDTVVCIDDYLGPFPAQVRPFDRWNGWLKPRFTREVAEQLVEQFNSKQDQRDSDPTRFAWEGDDLIEHCEDPEDDERLTARAGYYHVGSAAWVWSLWWDWTPDRRLATRGEVKVEILQQELYRTERGEIGTFDQIGPGPVWPHSEGRAAIHFGDRVVYGDLEVSEAFRRAEALALREQPMPI